MKSKQKQERGVCNSLSIMSRRTKRGNNQKKSGSKEEKLGNVRREVREGKKTSGRCEMRWRKENAGKERKRRGQ